MVAATALALSLAGEACPRDSIGFIDAHANTYTIGGGNTESSEEHNKIVTARFWKGHRVAEIMLDLRTLRVHATYGSVSKHGNTFCAFGVPEVPLKPETFPGFRREPSASPLPAPPRSRGRIALGA